MEQSSDLAFSISFFEQPTVKVKMYNKRHIMNFSRAMWRDQYFDWVYLQYLTL